MAECNHTTTTTAQSMVGRDMKLSTFLLTCCSLSCVILQAKIRQIALQLIIFLKVDFSRKCNAGNPWTLIKGQVMPRIESTNLVGDLVAAAMEEVATKSTRKAVINVIRRNNSQDIFRYKICFFLLVILKILV